MNEKNVNIWQENLFGVFWGGNVHNLISMFQLNSMLWAYEEAKFDCVDLSHWFQFLIWYFTSNLYINVCAS